MVSEQGDQAVDHLERALELSKELEQPRGEARAREALDRLDRQVDSAPLT